MGEIELREGRIYKSLSGFYYIWSQGQVFTSRAKGLFRHQKIKPLVGDWVTFEYNSEDDLSDHRLTEIHTRKNQLVRPPVANVDFAMIVMSLVEPDFSFNLLNNYLLTVEINHIVPIILLSKYDLFIQEVEDSQSKLMHIIELYQSLGYKVVMIDHTQNLKAIFESIMQPEAVYVIMGQSGVGKSTLINHLIPDLNLETNQISQSLNRGKHTTRDVQLYDFKGALIADTPGFSAMDLTMIDKYDLGNYYPDLAEASKGCKFSSCLHINEPKCQVKADVAAGKIDASRYNHYVNLFKQIDQKKINYR
ncbi:ribosome small subunit-dependent GTPase A [Eremococcus coleocola]|uniref:ribosome small subunit-dependent GTPase A n=1 Tax=Eremococcus coleocola TaxID=88132 RepID=UPI00040596B1|nr:ribosome small subunit-dependent GTPase A [Eremococcus coleocola]